MKTVVSLALCLVMGPVAAAQDSKQAGGVSHDAMKILEKSEAALKKVRIARYQASYKGTKWIEAMVPVVEGMAIIGKRSKWDVDPFFVEVKMTLQDADAPINCTAGCNGDTFFLTDAENKTIYEDMDPLVLGSRSRDIQRVLMREFAAPKPFENAEKASTVQLQGTQGVSGEECYVVFVEGEEPPAILYYIATKDYLPRKITRVYKNEEGEEGTTELTIRNLTVNPSFARSPFAVFVPAGFTKTDEFAP